MAWCCLCLPQSSHLRNLFCHRLGWNGIQRESGSALSTAFQPKGTKGVCKTSPFSVWKMVIQTRADPETEAHTELKMKGKLVLETGKGAVCMAAWQHHTFSKQLSEQYLQRQTAGTNSFTLPRFLIPVHSEVLVALPLNPFCTGRSVRRGYTVRMRYRLYFPPRHAVCFRKYLKPMIRN